MISGGLAGMIAKSVVAPLDRVKILFQVSNTMFRFSMIPPIVRKIITEEGFTALWKGNTATLVRVFPYAGVQFMVFDALKSHILNVKNEERNRALSRPGDYRDPSISIGAFNSMLAGSAAGGLSSIVTYPLDLTRARLAVLHNAKNDANKPRFTTIIAENYRTNGFRGLYRGITPTLLGMIPYAGIAFTINEEIRHFLEVRNGRPVTPFEKLQSGGLAGLVAQSLTYPLDVTRRRMQTIGLVNPNRSLMGGLSAPKVSPTATTTAVSKHSGSGMIAILLNLLSSEGVRGLYKGLTVNWIKGPVAFGISFSCFDYFKVSQLTKAQNKERKGEEYILLKMSAFYFSDPLSLSLSLSLSHTHTHTHTPTHTQSCFQKPTVISIHKRLTK